jgi:hypothetical protein
MKETSACLELYHRKDGEFLETDENLIGRCHFSFSQTILNKKEQMISINMIKNF